MNNLFATDKKKKIVLISIYATVAVIVCLLAALLITQIANKPDEPQGGQPQTPAVEFTDLTVTPEQILTGDLVLVNATHEYNFEANLVPVSIMENKDGAQYGLAGSEMFANPTALKAFNKMMKDAYQNISGANITIQTAFRSYEAQDGKHQANPQGTLPAGFSDFHTGMSFELKDEENSYSVNSEALNGKYKWLYDNAHKYGFIVRYPEAKKDTTGVSSFEQTFRYVGVAHATYIYKNNLCLEEYVELLRGYTSEAPLVIKGADGKNYEVYYATANESSQIKVPAKNVYTVSGNNAGGYIVTIHKSEKLNTNAQ